VVGDGELLERLWPVLDPALDDLPAHGVLEAGVDAMRTSFGVTAAAVVLEDGERVGTDEDDPAWDAAPRLDLPLQDGRREVGRLEISRPGGIADDGERLALRLCAARLGRAVARRLAEEAFDDVRLKLRGDAYAVQRLLAAAGALMARHELEHVVQYVTDEATEIVEAQFGAFFYNVLDGAGGSYMLYTLSGVPREAFSRFPMPRNTDVFAPTFAGEGIVRSADITQDPRYGRNAPLYGMPPGHLPVRSYLAVPVKARDGEVLGGLFFGHSSTGVFGDDVERLVTGVATLAALAIENARLHDDAQRQLAASRQAYEERDQVARVLQESLMPRELPAIAGLDVAARYAPGQGVVGGDFYDLFPLAGAWCATIGDVQGKDARAAARSGLVRHAVRMAAADAADPAGILRAVNAVVLAEQEPEDRRFATLVVALLGPREGRGWHARIASGGHPPALVLRRDGTVAEGSAPGMLLGEVEAVEVGEQAVDLEPGDALVLYTDGLTEARHDGVLLGEARLRELLAAQAGAGAEELAEALERASLSFSGGHRADDLALLVLRADG
jgi:serine phosphatase RsbU (regulator of sigma subunit)